MISSEQPTARPPLWRALLLLGLLVGVLGMHALAPGGGMGGHEGRSAHRTTSAAVVAADAVCHDGCGSGRPHHADATCVSGAVSGGPVLPALVPDPSGTCLGTVGLRARTAVSREGSRAPPSLAELQLLRI
ncbi:hypothetical protein M2164_002092 [Streptomyces sp. SAI-208]|uniref:DUF6153 family protein n=1 Tax=unclassified Streptomyces TaxID=2593676 RepID=UPI0024734D63|nr:MULTISPECIES: DUF6153 family protein [unclassified Streptomyces]MDH6566923.1 hypothetical protein [Streptomyces sp. SAI-117]MDH6588138.1 hypothetical protein [Streptomyces sp. SAI-133]MDH6606457.1 hypothetical protein [Streptomyces sp. SAI-208]